MRLAMCVLSVAGMLGATVGPAWADPPAVPKGGLTPVVLGSAPLSTVGSTTAESTGAAGTPRDATPAPGAPAIVSKPAASPRVLRRIKADRVVASLQPAFRGCYAQSNSRASGIVVVRASTAAEGQVESVEIVSQGGLPLGLAQCVAGRVRTASFGAPGGVGVSVLVPVRLGP